MKKTLILGYGNPDREDDGVAWHILVLLARRLGRPVSDDFSDELVNPGETPDLVFLLQLSPELAETLAEYERVCLIDAHTGAVPEEVHIETVDPHFQTSPFTHHFTPQSLLSMTEALYQKKPETLLVSVRGYQFDFSHQLSHRTAALARQAEEQIWTWLNQ